MSIRVINPGALTTVQDLGRSSFQSMGVRVCGVMDRNAYRAAVELVGGNAGQKQGIGSAGQKQSIGSAGQKQGAGSNAQKQNCGDAVLEMTLFGGTYRFEDDTVFALAGADMMAKLDGQPCPMYRTVAAKAGQTLSLGFAQSGCRTYLAFAGGVDVPAVMGSRSTDIKCKIGGFMGRALKAGDLIPVGNPEDKEITGNLSNKEMTGNLPDNEPTRNPEGKDLTEKTVSQKNQICPPSEKIQLQIEAKYRSDYPQTVEICAIPGPQDDMFTQKGLDTFFSSEYLVTNDSDRMGYRLSGGVIESKAGTDIISDGIVFGSVQVSANGLPIVLMADRQTTGGYAKIATVVSSDLPKLAQCRPGCRLHFKKVSVESMQQNK